MNAYTIGVGFPFLCGLGSGMPWTCNEEKVPHFFYVYAPLKNEIMIYKIDDKIGFGIYKQNAIRFFLKRQIKSFLVQESSPCFVPYGSLFPYGFFIALKYNFTRMFNYQIIYIFAIIPQG